VANTRGIETALLARLPDDGALRSWWPRARCRLISPAAAPPLELLLVAAKLSLAGFRCKVVDYEAEGLEWGALRSDIVRHRPSLIVFGASLITLDRELTAVREAKALVPDSAVVLCGRDLLFEEARIHWECPDLDAIISDPFGFAGPGRLKNRDALLRLAQSGRLGASVRISSFSGREMLKINRMLMSPWEMLKLPLYKAPLGEEARLPVLVSVGCKHSCLHCLVPRLSGGVAQMKRPSLVVREMRRGLLDMGQHSFELVGDNLAPPDLWWEELVDEMSRAGLKTARFSFRTCECGISAQLAKRLQKAGCDMATIVLPVAFERAASELAFGPKLDRETCIGTLRTLRGAGILTCVCFVAGLLESEEEDLAGAMRLVTKGGASVVEVLDANCTSGSRLDDMLKRKRLAESQISARKSADRSYSDGVSALAARAARRFWLRPSSLIGATRRFGPSALAKVARMLLSSARI